MAALMTLAILVILATCKNADDLGASPGGIADGGASFLPGSNVG
ncbi:hypothetical protein JOD01_003748 [Brevibacillus fulvus]|uniref:Uncharacterized protein n=1 Tax=Brevibacillus fulvus TaxID=1125967 RepID=A0A939BWT1_9BACL|nr:hypothetical protein [Brevibacillus fulvus]